jgi:RNase P subunit RPR2
MNQNVNYHHTVPIGLNSHDDRMRIARVRCRHHAECAETLHKKAYRVRSPKNAMLFLSRLNEHRQFLRRYRELLDGHKFSRDFLVTEYRMRLERKAKGKKRFETEYRVISHRGDERLDADYGTHICENCHSMFYYSPRFVLLGTKTVHKFVCAHCADKFKGKSYC